MLRQLLTGGLISLGNIAIHAVVMGAVVTTGRRAGNWKGRHSQFWLAAVMVATVDSSCSRILLR